MDDLLADFLTETTENLTDLDGALVKLERTPDDRDTLALIFRLVHTIKGTCGFLGLPRLERVAHAAENVLGRVRDGELSVAPDIVTTILAAVDRVKEIVQALAATGGEPAGDDAALIAALDAATSSALSAGAAPKLAPATEPIPTTPIPTTPIPTMPISTMPALARTSGAQVPEPGIAAPGSAPAPAAPTASINAIPPEPTPADAAGQTFAETVPSQQTIRVGVDVLEDLMTLVSELVLTRNQLLQLARTHEARDTDANGFTVPLQRLSHITTDLQEGVMKTRMQPVGNAWQKLPRLVRDVARDLGKRIELEMVGAETELDRQVLDLIRDPLTHMVRNAADHGLEAPASRLAAGKHETGRIALNAYHEGGHIFIEISDDGAGLPVDRIRAKVLAKGLATEAELVAMTDAQVQAFIFQAGFSTATQITAVSGRGVGMDVVRTNIEKIGGTIDLKSEAGRGTTFLIRIPLTLTIVAALIVESGGERFAIPQISVVELVRASLDTSAARREAGRQVVEHINGTPVLRLRDRLLPLVRLDELLALAPPDQQAGARVESDRDVHVVVAKVGTATFGIVVDRVFATEEIVVKPVAPILRHITLFSGNTILGDGSVIMILDPNGIARRTGLADSAGTGDRNRAGSQTDAQGPAQHERTPMLVFRAGDAAPKAVPLGLISRLEDLPREALETSSGHPVAQYRGRLMPLVPLSGSIDPEAQRHAVLVFTDGDAAAGHERCMGLVVDEIVDFVNVDLRIELSGDRPGILGTAVVAGRATDILDTSFWLTRACKDWFRRDDITTEADARILVVDDSAFFRQLLVPALSAVGYHVTAVRDGTEALNLHNRGVMFDAIVSDIEMPRTDGKALVRRIRAGGAWQNLPVIALTGHAEPVNIAAGRDAGFTDYVAKFERDVLLASLRQCLAARTETAGATSAVPHERAAT